MNSVQQQSKPLGVGDRVPEVVFRTRTEDDWLDVDSRAVFAGRTVVVFSLPGAFTPTCSGSQLPGYNRLAGEFRQRGVDEIVCLAVNDAFVMREWGLTQNAENVRLIPDGNGEFTRGMGMLVDKQALGFGQRSWRYSMLVRNGVIEQIFPEPQVPGDPYEVSDPETLLRYLDPDIRMPDDIALFVRAGCPHCTRAKALLKARGIVFDSFETHSPQALHAVAGATSTPQVFVNGECIGGADELEAYLASH